jgi:hypothetical protein
MDDIGCIRVSLCSVPTWLEHTSVATPPPPPANLNIQDRLTSWFAGSGDPEVEDAVDPCEFLTLTYGNDPDLLMRDLAAVNSRIEGLDPSWMGQSLQSCTCRVLSHW